MVRVLPDGTYLSVLIDPRLGRRRREEILAAAAAGADLADEPAHADDYHLVRVVEYDVPDRDGAGTGELITLLSSILDPGQARADELAAAYDQRWEEETGNDQLKTGNRVVGTPADQIIVLGNGLAGYVQTKSGRQVIVMIAVGNVPISAPADVLTVTEDQARMAEAIQQLL